MPRGSATAGSSLEQRIGRALLAASDEGVVAVQDGVVVACSAHAAELLDCDPQAVQGLPLESFVERLDGELVQLHLLSALRVEEAVQFIAPRPGRADAWLRVRSLPLAPGLALFVRDVTERELGERNIRRKEQRLLAANLSLRLAHAAAQAASWEWRSGRPLRWLDLAAARDLQCLPPGWTDDEEIGDWRALMPPSGRRAFGRALVALNATGLGSCEVEVVGADGAAHWVRIDFAVTERNALGEPSRVSGVTVDVTAAHRAAEELKAEVARRKRGEERQQLLVHELNHRVKNMLATVQSIARQTLGAPGANACAKEFEERLMALAWAYEILTRESWAGASLREIIDRTLAPHAPIASERVRLNGPDLWLTPNKALMWALAVHELATNAIKYGALAGDDGRVEVRWLVDPQGETRRLAFQWIERDGPPVTQPTQRGFGSRLLERSFAREMDADVALRFDPAGLEYVVTAALPAEASLL